MFSFGCPLSLVEPSSEGVSKFIHHATITTPLSITSKCYLVNKFNCFVAHQTCYFVYSKHLLVISCEIESTCIYMYRYMYIKRVIWLNLVDRVDVDDGGGDDDTNEYGVVADVAAVGATTAAVIAVFVVVFSSPGT